MPVYIHSVNGICKNENKNLKFNLQKGGVDMTKEEQVKKLTDYMAKFIAYTAKKLPDDVSVMLIVALMACRRSIY